ncbi:MAG TPA: ArsI/CadI family heavy metal resistance metalloenzyme [Planctomycetaceae bacterium]|jgi:catechol 2,3-dioxygenase-like lactoylglutathione lyase family enzyme|nr:ArsI/CadI family heavy metal resistance metalloenzyme [Planctomycetaceae bacterium]
MDTATDKKLTKFHLSLNVSDLARSIDFYQQLFATPPAKRHPDYAKFELDDPPLVLSLEPAGASGGGALNHIGFRVADAEQLVELQRRLEVSGLSSIREEGVECCYSRQTKFWIQDPDKTLWEFYVLESDGDCASDRKAPQSVVSLDRRQLRTESHPTPAKSPQPVGAAPAATEWEHRLGCPFPRPLPFGDQTLNEIRLRGTFNVPCDPAIRDAMLVDCLRALKPGGRIVLHHLTSNAPLPANSLPLPGPAAVVEEVPIDVELLAAVERAGFCDVRLLKFGSAPSFTLRGVELRETIIQAVKSPQAEEESIVVMYKGPFRELIDDAGRVFRRGDRVWISPSAWDRLCSGSFEDSFVRLKSEPRRGSI